MAFDNVTALENLKSQREELRKQLDSGREMYLKMCGAIDVLEQIEESKQQDEQLSEAEAEVQVQ